MSIRIAIADDHLLIINGLESMLKKNKDYKFVFAATNGTELLEKLEENRPDILLLDIQIPGMNGIDLCAIIRKQYPLVKIIALTNHEETHFVKQMMRNGASGYLLKNTDSANLSKAIERVYMNEQFIDSSLEKAMLDEMLLGKRKSAGGVVLTKREVEILGLIANEHSNQEIADKLFISLRTVETHRLNINQKLNVKNAAGLVKEAFSRGLI